MTYKRLEALMKEGFDVDSEYNTIEKKWMDVLLKMFAVSLSLYFLQLFFH